MFMAGWMSWGGFFWVRGDGVIYHCLFCLKCGCGGKILPYCASAVDMNKCFYDTTMDAVGLERARLIYLSFLLTGCVCSILLVYNLV